jgi:omega-amidase
MQNLKISIVQSSLHWEDPAANLNMFSEKLNNLKEATDLIVLPEMFTTGFAVDRERVAEEHGGHGLQWLQQKAKEKNCVITGSIAVKDKGKLVNRLYWAEPSGAFQYYDKRHLFRMAGENKHFTAGENNITCELKGWKIRPLICYDLRFPVWARNTWSDNYQAGYDVLLYVANWPEVRNFPWKSLLVARAIENQAYTIGVNRVGADGNNITHSGDSAVLNPRGEQLSKIKAHEEGIETIELDYNYLAEFRKQFPVGMDADRFELS